MWAGISAVHPLPAVQMWAFGFPTAGLAWAAVLYDMTVNTALR